MNNVYVSCLIVNLTLCCFGVQFSTSLVQIGPNLEPDIYVWVLKDDHVSTVGNVHVRHEVGSPVKGTQSPAGVCAASVGWTPMSQYGAVHSYNSNPQVEPFQQISSCTMMYVRAVIDRKTNRKIQIVLFNGLYSFALGEADVGTLFSFPVHCSCEINCSFRAMSEWSAASL